MVLGASERQVTSHLTTKITSERLFLFAGLVLLPIGLSPILSYHTGSLAFALPFSAGRLSAYSAGVGVTLLALSMLLNWRGWGRAAIPLNGVVILIGVVALVQTIFIRDLGLNHALWYVPETKRVPVPDRMAPETAWCLILSATMLAAYAILRRLELRRIVVSTLAVMVASLGAAAVVTVGWPEADGLLPGSGFQTQAPLGIAFLALSGAMAWISRAPTAAQNGMARRRLVMAGVAVATLIVTFAWRLAASTEIESVQRLVGLRADYLSLHLQGEISEMISAFERSAQASRWPPARDPEWPASIAGFLGRYPACRVTGWHSPGGIFEPLGGGTVNPAHRNPAIQESWRQLVAEAQAKRGVASFLHGRHLAQPYLILIAPLQVRQRDHGHLIGSCNASEIVRIHLAHNLGLNQLNGSVVAGGRVIFEQQAPPGPADFLRFPTAFKQPMARRIELSDMQWTLSVTPAPGLVKALFATWPDMLLFCGLNGIFLVGLLVHLVQESNERAREAEQARGQIAKVEEERRQAAALLDRFFTQSMDLFAIVEGEGTWRKLNPAWEKTLGYAIDDLNTRHWTELIHPDDLQATADLMARIRKHAGSYTIENRWIAKNGSARSLLWSVSSIPEEDTRLMVAKDVTDLKLSQAELAAQAEELRAKNEELALALTTAKHAMDARNRFLATVSHEIRTPMNGIIGMTELLMTTGLDGAQREYSIIVKQSAQSLLAMVNDLLDLAKIEAGKMELESVEFSPSEVVRLVIALMHTGAIEKNLELTTDVDPDLPARVTGDPNRLRQVLLNLVGNALKFTEEGSIVVRVKRVSQGPSAASLRFEVADTGIGIESGQVNRVFESFTQADQSDRRKYGGTGLGLAISKQLVEAMGGEIACESRPGEGSTFRFVLTFRVPDSETVEPRRPESQAEGTYSVLVVEDNRVNQRVATSILRRSGYRVDAVSNGEESLEAVDRAPYDLILMDVMMPVMDGLTATAEIRRREPDGHHVPIVAMTANAFAGDREKCLAAGMDDYVSKPVTPAALNEVLSRWLPAREEAIASPGQITAE